MAHFGASEAMQQQSRFRKWLGLIVVVGLAARVAVVLYAERDAGRFDYPDSQRYLRVARNIASGRGPIDEAPSSGAVPADGIVWAGTDPLYPAILAAGLRLGLAGGGDVRGMMRFGRAVNVLFGTAAVGLLALIGRRLGGEGIGLIAAALLAVDPIIVFFHGLVLTETCFVMLLLTCVYFMVRLDGCRGTRWAVLGGAALGLAILARSSSLLLPLVLLPLVWCRAPRPLRPRVAALFLGACGLLLAPTVVRNYRLSGRLVPVRTGSGASLLEAWGPWADGGPGMDRIRYPTFSDNADEFERDRIAWDAALAWAGAHTGRVAALAWNKLRRTWSVTPNAPGYSSTAYTAFGWLTVAPVFAAAIVGIVCWRRRPWALALLLTPAAYFTLLHMVFVGSVRYRIPAMPGVFLLAAAGVQTLWRRSGRGAAPASGTE
ncbi:MAG: ArnT family glycosyltransferase [Phycisphaerae bacterium]